MNVLTLDGGGVFGIGQARILEAANVDKFDALAGTSIGAVLATGLALGIDKRSLVDLFEQYMPGIFRRNPVRMLNPLTAKYSPRRLEGALQEIFLGAKFGDCRRPVFIPAADVANRRLKVWCSLDADDGAFDAWEILRGATAAPTYFPSWRGIADGGVFANNPAMVAAAGLVGRGEALMDDLRVFSLGFKRFASNVRVRGGLLFWNMWLIDAMLNGAADEMQDYFAKSMPTEKYLRATLPIVDDLSFDSARDMRAADDYWTNSGSYGYLVKMVDEF